MNSQIELCLKINKQVVIHPKGKSMFPFVKENRDTVTIVPPDESVKKYDIVLYKRDNLYVLHRVIDVTDKYYKICGDNQAVIEYVGKEKIVGVVSEIKSQNKTKHIRSVFVSIWYNLGVKRIYLLVKRLIKK